MESEESTKGLLKQTRKVSRDYATMCTSNIAINQSTIHAVKVPTKQAGDCAKNVARNKARKHGQSSQKYGRKWARIVSSKVVRMEVWRKCSKELRNNVYNSSRKEVS